MGPRRVPCVNGGDDASILYHEYTHGLSNRLVTDAAGIGALNTAQAGAMGEGWGDWYAKDFIVNQFPQLDTAAPAEVDMGDYIDLIPHSIRRQALDCPVTGATALQCPPGFGNTGSGGFTYSDFGKVNGLPEVHGDGEIWAQTLWDLRACDRVGQCAAADHAGDAAVAAGAVVPGHAQRDPAGRRRRGRCPPHADLAGVRESRDGLLRRDHRFDRRRADRGQSLPPSRAARAAASRARSPTPRPASRSTA